MSRNDMGTDWRSVRVWKPGGIFVHKSARSRFGKKSTRAIREAAMKKALTEAQEAEAKELAAAMAEAAAEEFLQVARTLVGSDNSSLFGDTEFKIRDILLRVGAKTYEQHLAQKKTATKGPA
jgi:hypothetical protein